MKYRIEIHENQEEDIIISAKAQTDLLCKIEAILESRQEQLLGYANGETVPLNGEDVLCFYVETGKVYAMTEQEKWQVKERLYQLEQQYEKSFVKINQSCLVNLSAISKFQSSIGGSLSVVLKNGYRDYISRRQLRTVKERMGF